MLKTMHLVGVFTLGFTGFGAAQSAQATVPSFAPKQAPAQANGGAALNLGSSLTQQLARAALLLHAQAPLWSGTSGSEAAPVHPKTDSKAAPAPIRPAPAVSRAATTPAAVDLNLTALPHLPGSALIEQVVRDATAVAPATPKLVAVQTAPTQTLVQAAPAKPAAPRPQSVAQPVQNQAAQQAAQVKAAQSQAAQARAAQVKAAQAKTAQFQAAQVKVAQLKAAQAKAAQLKAAQVMASQSPVTRPSTAVSSGVSRVVRATAYSSDVGQTDSSPFITATGTRVRPGVIALSRDLLRVFPYGSRVTLRDSAGLLSGRTFIVEDTMNVRLSNTIDIWMGSRGQAIQWGARSVSISSAR
ncbi:hypothetical protein GCM10022631_31190 [Deinococcus rubellus]|uniref:3D domain-containing protein n=1 Tax=Deinococcus rubellus TaxID=1889240 RepID=A0ABY5YGP8_9DEIO|nr:3D domain-containing protein [Deinococcus rubellus]UWX63459.1 3D domain-containing protein [Deinococcus rubellus]